MSTGLGTVRLWKLFLVVFLLRRQLPVAPKMSGAPQFGKSDTTPKNWSIWGGKNNFGRKLFSLRFVIICAMCLLQKNDHFRPNMIWFGRDTFWTMVQNCGIAQGPPFRPMVQNWGVTHGLPLKLGYNSVSSIQTSTCTLPILLWIHNSFFQLFTRIWPTNQTHKYFKYFTSIPYSEKLMGKGYHKM